MIFQPISYGVVLLLVFGLWGLGPRTQSPRLGVEHLRVLLTSGIWMDRLRWPGHIVFRRFKDNRRCLNGGGTTSSRRHDPDRLRLVDIRTGRSTTLPGITASEVRRQASRFHERLRVCCLQRES